MLISGASVAGPVLAYWLNRFGFQANGRGEDWESFGSAVAAMPLTSSIRLCRSSSGWALCRRFRMLARTPRSFLSSETDIARLMWRRSWGRKVYLSAATSRLCAGSWREIIHEAGRNDVEYLFGNSISSLEEIDQGVDITFQHGSPQTFDLVIGADGLRSITRRLAFGEEYQFLHFLGGYLAVFTVPNYLRPPPADAGLR